MEVSDDVHWAEVYGVAGTVVSYSMGKTRTGKWRIEDGQLCVEFEDSAECIEVWDAGQKVQFRRVGSDLTPTEGVLRNPVPHR